jgi:NADH:ubiquinone oxidoreductase subunit F (NADH-binding)
VALIARHGAAWFRSGGSGPIPGTALVSISGVVRAPGVYEIPAGTPLPDLLGIAGGRLQEVRALLVGGYFGGWVDGAGEGLSFDDASLQSAGVAAGAGVVVALGAGDCPVAETAALAAWLAEESAGQCGPCVHGLGGLADVLSRIAGGMTVTGDAARLARWTEMVRGRGACRHPDGTARMISIATRLFASEFAEHARYGPCDACRRPRLLAMPGARRAETA